MLRVQESLFPPYQNFSRVPCEAVLQRHGFAADARDREELDAVSSEP